MQGYLDGRAQVSTTIARIVAALKAAGRMDLIRGAVEQGPIAERILGANERPARKRADKRAVA